MTAINNPDNKLYVINLPLMDENKAKMIMDLMHATVHLHELEHAEPFIEEVELS